MTKANLGITVNSCFSRLCRLCGVFSAVILLSTIVQAAPPTVSITGPTSGQIFVAPATITLSATASDPDAGGSVTKVEFFRGGSTLIGQATRVGTTNNYTFTWANVAAGTHALTAKATDNTNATATTAAGLA